MTREPLSSCTIRSLSSTGRPFFVHLMSGLGSPPTEQVSITWSATLTVASLSGTDTWGGTAKHSSPHRGTCIHTCMKTLVNLGAFIYMFVCTNILVNSRVYMYSYKYKHYDIIIYNIVFYYLYIIIIYK